MPKRLAKLVISAVFFCLWKMMDTIRFLLGKRRRGTLSVLYYHGVPAEDRVRFAKKMDILRKTVVPVDLGFHEPLEPNKHYVSITFDDAFRSIFLHAFPEMEKRGIPAAIFVPTGYIGKKADWIRDPRHEAFGEPVMTPMELLEVHGKGVTLGSHGVLHLDLGNASEEQIRSELRDSKKDLEDLTGRETKFFAFPYGRYSDLALQCAREMKYQSVFSDAPSLRPEDGGTFFRGRMDVSCGDWPIEFRLKLMGAYRWMETAIRFKRSVKARWKRRESATARAS